MFILFISFVILLGTQTIVSATTLRRHVTQMSRNFEDGNIYDEINYCNVYLRGKSRMVCTLAYSSVRFAV